MRLSRPEADPEGPYISVDEPPDVGMIAIPRIAAPGDKAAWRGFPEGAARPVLSRRHPPWTRDWLGAELDLFGSLFARPAFGPLGRDADTCARRAFPWVSLLRRSTGRCQNLVRVLATLSEINSAI